MQTAASITHIASDNDYAVFEKLIADRVASARGPLFTTNAEGLFDAYLAGIAQAFRQHYTCHCCRRFITNFGGLATMNEVGGKFPLLWELADVPEFFRTAAATLFRLVDRAKITGVFINGDKTWGNPQTGNWTHLSGNPPTVFASPIKSAFQESAEKTQDYITLKKGLEDYPLEAVVQAVRVLEADAVDRSEKTLGVAQWLLTLHRAIADVRGPTRDNLVWLAVAKAAPGWCHIRSTMISTLLDDVVKGLPFDSIKARWNEKMHPLQYQRPTAPPKEGNIAQANAVVAKLQSEGALERRFARLDEIRALWTTPKPDQSAGKRTGGAFDHLKAKSAIKEVELPATKITWEKFLATVLPSALEIEAALPSYRPMPFYGLVTAVNAEAPPLLQWDGLEGLPRNPVSWYFWHGGSTAEDWGLIPGWNKIAAVCLKPCHWHSDKFVHQGPGVFFVIEAARDSRESGGGFFPEMLRAEYHGIRSVMEAHARASKIAGMLEGNANGIALQDQALTVRVKSKDGLASYLLSL